MLIRLIKELIAKIELGKCDSLFTKIATEKELALTSKNLSDIKNSNLDRLRTKLAELEAQVKLTEQKDE